MPFDAAIKQAAIPHPWAFKKGLAASSCGSLQSTSTSQSSISSTAASTPFTAIVWEQGKPRRVRAATSFKSSAKVSAYFQEELTRELCIVSSERGAGASERTTP
jgi:hypothetical protein